ncbi:phage integrase family protein [Burkholderia vietnamiensis]|uniref:phage integrase family protein n=1 Tax=Burkholderia vietnamiensis TaxID=60552 RepID=UPI001E32A637|nr:phage integrase family protein [Burkholderia vietnamiensis]
MPGTDLRVTRRTLAMLRDTLTIAAGCSGDVDAAHLLRLKPGSLPRDAHAGGAAGGAAGREVLTLEAFRAEVDPDAFYSERELVALYVETYPPATSPALDRKVARNRRLRDRQDAALACMEASLVEAPQPEHTLGGWFDVRLVARLAAAGITTFAELLALMRVRRRRWYRAVPRVGAIGAQRISDFIAQHPDTLGYLSPLAVTPRRQLVAGRRGAARGAARAGGARRLGRLEPRAGARAPGRTEHRPEGGPCVDRNPRRAYRRAAERLLPWAIAVNGAPLSSLHPRD